MKPIVQISLDITTKEEALETAALAMRAGVDWLEAGTPLIIAEGMHGVRALRERFPETPIVADLKTMDGGYLEAEMMAEQSRPFRLRDAVTALLAEQRANPAEVPYTYLLIDCPPSLNLLTLNAMVAAHAVLVPVQCEFFALEGISQLKATIDQIRGTLNPALEIQGVVLTMHDARTTLSKEVAAEVRNFFGAKVYETMIPRNVRVAEAPSHGKPIMLYDYDSPGSQAYIRLAHEIIERERQLRAA